MRDHDLELIAALVEGRLEDETEARALIASSAEAREEYEAHKLAYESLRALGTAHLTEEERAALHRDVWTELRTETTTKGTKTPRYYRWAAVAAGLFVITGLVAVLSGGGQEMAESFDEIAAELSGDGEAGADTTTTAAGAAADMDSGGDDAGGESAPTETTEVASEGTTTAAANDESATFYEAEAARVRQGEFTARLQDYEEEAEEESGEVEACLERAGLVDYRPVATLTVPDPGVSDGEESLVVAAPQQTVLAEAPLAFVDLDTCELLYVDSAPG
ncbi:MAG TPA: hypothetical protein VF148_17825 [Acidimicrobiia bacterium]